MLMVEYIMILQLHFSDLDLMTCMILPSVISCSMYNTLGINEYNKENFIGFINEVVFR